MIKSIVYKTSAAAIIGGSVLGCIPDKGKDTKESEKPNIIFLFTDDQVS